jgi:hypothetical protein
MVREKRKKERKGMEKVEKEEKEIVASVTKGELSYWWIEGLWWGGTRIEWLMRHLICCRR